MQNKNDDADKEKKTVEDMQQLQHIAKQAAEQRANRKRKHRDSFLRLVTSRLVAVSSTMANNVKPTPWHTVNAECAAYSSVGSQTSRPWNEAASVLPTPLRCIGSRRRMIRYQTHFQYLVVRIDDTSQSNPTRDRDPAILLHIWLNEIKRIDAQQPHNG